MRADRIEVPKDCSLQILVRMGIVADKLLVDLLGVAVWAERLLDGSVLRDWEVLPPSFRSSSQTGMGRDEILDYIGNILTTL